jgi:hypothetical protein
MESTAHDHRRCVERHDWRHVPGLQPAITVTAFEALWLSGEASVDTAELMDALTQVLHRHPRVQLVDISVASLRPAGNSVIY